MSTEYPPIIIDGTNLCEQPRPDEGFTFSAAAPAVAPERVTIKPSLVSLYLILDNQVIHQGDYTTEQIRLVWGSEESQSMTVGGSSMTLDVACLQKKDSGATHVQRGATSVTEIYVPSQKQPLVAGKDFHNFLIVVQRRG